MSVPIHIEADFGTILANYPAHTQLPPALKQTIDALNKPYLPAKGPNTSCCLQVCHALNRSGIMVPSGNFRPEEPKRVAVQIPAKSGPYYLMAVNEMINYLTRTFPPAPLEFAGKARSSSKADVAAFTAEVQGLEGVMTFGNGHIELWNRYNIVQDTGGSVMDAGWVWGQSPVRFWRIGSTTATTASGLEVIRFDGWWDVNDGEQYYYLIDVKKGTVSYTKTKPKTSIAKNTGMLNSGDITISGHEIVFDWDPADGGATRETFTLGYGDPSTMKGRSNRYGPLVAKKMFV